MNFHITKNIPYDEVINKGMEKIKKMKISPQDKIHLAAFFNIVVIESCENEKNTEEQNRLCKDLMITTIIILVERSDKFFNELKANKYCGKKN